MVRTADLEAQLQRNSQERAQLEAEQVRLPTLSGRTMDERRRISQVGTLNYLGVCSGRS